MEIGSNSDLLFAGIQVNNKGVCPSKEFLENISNLPSPTSRKEVRAFFGLINQVNYVFCETNQMEPFCHVLGMDMPFE